MDDSSCHGESAKLGDSSYNGQSVELGNSSCHRQSAELSDSSCHRLSVELSNECFVKTENRTMKKASMISISITTFFYLCCGCFGYAAFGNETPGNLLTGFGFYEPYWLVDFANVCVIIHLVGGYQVYSQSVFAVVERWLSEKYPNSEFMNNSYRLKILFLPAYNVNLLRLGFRTAYVVTTTGIAMIFPYFNQVLGVLGALNFWPLTIYFPVKMYFVQQKIAPWTRKWVILQTFSIICLIVTLVALVGSIEGLITAKLS
ncbi:probable amino acid permease 7 [Aristolochia californica]|uniref:probable amino acid permease 7 n=1 Tax=Aristolochia californica TaxID=171875 RepID=UPI0035DEAC4D